jgi:arylsulfatase A-like enzyme
MFSPGEYRALAPSMKYFDMNPDIREAYREKHVRTQDPQEPEGNLALYDANIRYADDNICRLVDSLPSLDIDKDEILFVITSDHGEAFGEYGFWDHYSAYRNVGQVPLIFRGPGIEKGRVPGYTQHVDILPTLCDMAGYEIQGSICGKSMTGLLKDKTGAFRDEAVCESAFVAIQRMYIKDEYALVHTMHRQGRSHIKEYELFDLRNDRDQVNDISKEKPELAGEYRIAMEDWVSREAGGSAQDKLKYMAYRRDRIPEAFLLDERHY